MNVSVTEQEQINMKMRIINKIINLCPEIKNKRALIVSEIIKQKKPRENEYVFEKIEIDGKKYYKDQYDNIVDETTTLVGIYKDNKYIFFSEKLVGDLQMDISLDKQIIPSNL